MSTSERSVLAVVAHPDDIEFIMAGTMLLLRQAGYRLHYLNVANGSGGSQVYGPVELARIRRRESIAAAKLLGAEYHESHVNDLEIVYRVPLLRRITAVVREVKPTIILTHSPQDYMEDHMETSRLAVSAAFARGIRNFASQPRRAAWMGDTTIYHGMPHQHCDPLGRRVVPELLVDTTSVHATKLAALRCHQSQQEWLQASQGMNSYLATMEDLSRRCGRLSRRFRHAEGWRRHSFMGYCAPDADPLRAALGPRCRVNAEYRRRGLAEAGSAR